MFKWVYQIQPKFSLEKTKDLFGNLTQHTFFTFQIHLYISTYFFTYTYIKNTQNTLLKLSYQTGSKHLIGTT